MLTGPIRFSNDKSGLGFNKFASNLNSKKKVSKENPTFVKADIEKNFVKRKPIRKIQAIKIPKLVSHTQEEVQEVIPFESYKHTLPQPLIINELKALCFGDGLRGRQFGGCGKVVDELTSMEGLDENKIIKVASILTDDGPKCNLLLALKPFLKITWVLTLIGELPTA
ncbi:hypothetical protein LguiA_014301 [Lonicera macranthoides]